jgi:hypothetical protein
MSDTVILETEENQEMSESTYQCDRCRAVCSDDDAITSTEVPADYPVMPSSVVGHICETCWQELGFLEPDSK